MRLWLLPLLLALIVATLPGQVIHIYLKGGGDLLATEYEQTEDRVRYFSSERRQWEEIPLALVDMERTQAEIERQEQIRAERAAEDAEIRAAERRARTELHNVPVDDGVYYRGSDEVRPLVAAEVVEKTSKKRKILQTISPIPMVAGKKVQSIAGESSAFVVSETKPVFYMRLEAFTRFGIVRLDATEKQGERIVQVIATVPQAPDEMFEEQEEVEVFRQQLAPNVFRIWPLEPLEPGEYALIDYTPGQLDLRVWDFRIAPGAGGS